VLDYSADEAALGKHLGDDLAEGKATLPLIHAIAHAEETTRAVLRKAFEDGDTGAMPRVLAAIADAGSIAYSLLRAGDYARAAESALEPLAENPHVAALRGLARYAVSRDR
jgi:octaprenyl-diphosphate synthase